MGKSIDDMMVEDARQKKKRFAEELTREHKNAFDQLQRHAGVSMGRHPIQDRYKDGVGRDWIDECEQVLDVEQFRGAMIFTIGKYLRRLGKKDAVTDEVTKISDYAERWRLYEERHSDTKRS